MNPSVFRLMFMAALPAAGFFPASVTALPGELSGNLSLEVSAFAKPPLYPEQKNNYASSAMELEYGVGDDDERNLFKVKLFGRVDSEDERRTRGDIRELTYEFVGRRFEFRLGIRKVFWGVVESRHLVDILNQTDLVEAPDGEAKLGQPMVNGAWITDWGTFEVFVLPLFRERTFAGRAGRFRPGPPVRMDKVQYESPSEEKHVDYAARWSHTLGPWEPGLTYFQGTARDPEFVGSVDEQGSPILIPRYTLIRRGGLDLQFTSAGWLLKLEALHEEKFNHPDDDYQAAVTGLEYTFNGVFGTAADLGCIAEYLYDSRGESSPTPFDDDVFIAFRLQWNDGPGTELILGAIVDRHRGTTLLRLEGSRRLNESWKVHVFAQAVEDAPESDLALYAVRDDDVLQLKLSYFF